MISLLEDIQNRLDAGALLLNSTNQEARMGECCWRGYTCSVANITRGLDWPRMGLDTGVSVNDACSLSS